MIKQTDREKLYGSMDRNGYVTVKVKFNPTMLSVLGYHNALKPEDKPDLQEVEEILRYLGGRV